MFASRFTFRDDLKKIIDASPAYQTKALEQFVASMIEKGIYGEATDDEMDKFDALTDAADA